MHLLLQAHILIAYIYLQRLGVFTLLEEQAKCFQVLSLLAFLVQKYEY